MDEMELRINEKGIKWSWAFMVFSLVIWGVYASIKTHEISLPAILFILQNLVYFFVTSVEKTRVGDERGKKQLLIYFGVLFFLLTFGAILGLTLGR
ncbi:hypothetical protein [Pelolinea submarina]|nr:hypothetical protein [Pelolinea submarina]